MYNEKCIKLGNILDFNARSRRFCNESHNINFLCGKDFEKIREKQEIETVQKRKESVHLKIQRSVYLVNDLARGLLYGKIHYKFSESSF